MPIHMGGVSLVYQKLSRLVVGFAVTFLLCATPLPAMAQRGMTVTFLTDPDASLRIEDAVSPEQAGSYQVYVPSFMAFSRLPDGFNGAIWLRMVFGSSFEKPVGQLVANFGASLPGITRLYIPAQDGGFTLMESAPSSGIFALPENMPFPEILYARFDGTPGLWFRPALEAASGSPDAFPRHLALAGIFAFAMLALLIQYIRKGEQWLIWAALTAGCGIIASLLPATPTAGAAYTPLMAAAMLMPGLILVFFTHSARHLFNAPKTMPNYDKLFILYYFLGGIIALLPLVPGFLWFARYLPLVGIALALLLPAAMVAMALSLKGAPVFFCACLLPVVGVAASAWELTATKSPLVGGSGGLFGLAFGLVVWSFFGQVRHEEEKRADDDVFASLDRSLSTENAEATQDAAPQTSASSGPDTLIPQEVSSRQEAGRAALSDDAGEPPCDNAFAGTEKHGDGAWGEAPSDADNDFPDLSLFTEVGETDKKDPPALPADLTAPFHTPDISPAFPGAPPGVSPHASPDAPQAAAPTAAPLASAPVDAPAITLVDDEPFSEKPPLPTDDYTLDDAGQFPKTPFDLSLLIKEAYDAAAGLAEKKNVGLSWFIAPQTGRLFTGEAALLRAALSLLLCDMVEAVDRGNVRLTVRRLPDSQDTGHLVFTIIEWDSRETFYAHNMAGLKEAWALAEKTGGLFSVEHTPSSGTTVIFSSVFLAMDKIIPAEDSATAATNALRAGSGEIAPANSGIPVFTELPDNAAPPIALPDKTNRTSTTPRGIDGDTLLDGENADSVPLRVIVVDTVTSSRTKTAAMFAGSPYTVLECATPPASCDLYKRHPAAVVIMNADMPEGDIAAAIKDIHAFDESLGRDFAPFISLVGHAAQANRLLQAGSARALMKPVQGEDLLNAVKEMVPPPRPRQSADALPLLPQRPVMPALPLPAPVKDAEITLPQSAASSPEIRLRNALADIPPVSKRTEQEIPPRADAPIEPLEPAPGGIFDSILPETENAKPIAPPSSAPQETKPQNTVPPTVPLTVPRTIPQAIASQTQKKKQHVTQTNARSAPQPVSKPGVQAVSQTPPRTAVKSVQMVSQSAVRVSPVSTPVPPVSKKPDLELLDMIITEEEPDTPASQAAAATEKPGVQIAAAGQQTPAKTAPSAVVATAQRVTTRTPPVGNDAPKIATPKVASKIATPKVASGPAPQQVTQRQPRISLATPIMEVEDARTGAEQEFQPDSAKTSPVVEISEASIPLPGEEDSVFKEMLPLIPGLLVDFHDAMKDAIQGREEKKAMLVQSAAERIAFKAGDFGLVKLERLAQCVERAAGADDIESMECVLADLETWLARYKDALTQIHRSQW